MLNGSQLQRTEGCSTLTHCILHFSNGDHDFQSTVQRKGSMSSWPPGPRQKPPRLDTQLHDAHPTLPMSPTRKVKLFFSPYPLAVVCISFFHNLSDTWGKTLISYNPSNATMGCLSGTFNQHFCFKVKKKIHRLNHNFRSITSEMQPEETSFCFEMGFHVPQAQMYGSPALAGK